jgi:hypothetical protein
VHGVHDQSRTGGADRMADRDAAAVHVDDVLADAELGLRVGDDGPERLVDLDEIEIGCRDPLRSRACAIARAG